MSADPKTLAALAKATAKTKTKSITEVSGAPQDEKQGSWNGCETSKVEKCRAFKPPDEFVAGCAAAFINITALFPMNKLIFRQMVDGHKTQAAAEQMKEEGFRYLYRGILPPLIQKMITISIMFGSYGRYKEWADRKFCDSSHVSRLMIASIMTGTTEAVLTPLERVQMLLQDRNYHKKYKNTIDALIKLNKFGTSEYYRGLTCVIIRNCPSNILFFGLRDEIKKLMPNWSDKVRNKNNNPTTLSTQVVLISQQQQQPNSRQLCDPRYSQNNSSNTPIHSTHPQQSKDTLLHNFLSGAILGMFISTLFYPLSVVRTRIQVRAPGTEFLSIVQAFNAVYNERDRKFTRLFHGCLINVVRQFVSWGITNCGYEFVMDKLRDTE